MDSDNNRKRFLPSFFKDKNNKPGKSIDKTTIGLLCFMLGFIVGGHMVENILNYFVLLSGEQTAIASEYSRVLEAEIIKTCGATASSSIIVNTNLKLKPVKDIMDKNVLPYAVLKNIPGISIFGVSRQQEDYSKQISDILHKENAHGGQ